MLLLFDMNVQRDLFCNKKRMTLPSSESVMETVNVLIQPSSGLDVFGVYQLRILALFPFIWLVIVLPTSNLFIYFTPQTKKSYRTQTKKKTSTISFDPQQNNSVRNDSISSAQSDSVIHLRSGFLLTITSTNNHFVCLCASLNGKNGISIIKENTSLNNWSTTR